MSASMATTFVSSVEEMTNRAKKLGSTLIKKKVS